MKGTHRLDGSYGRFTRQRIALTIAALARDDDQERTRLWENAPKQKYLGHELAYARVWDLANEFTTGFAAVHLGPPWGVVEALGQTCELIDELSPVTEPLPADAGNTIPISNRPIDVLYALLQQRADIVVTATAEQVHGFSAFSQHELGVEGVDMIAAFARVFLPYYKAFATIEADLDVVAKIAEAFQEAWQLRLQRPPIL